MNKKVEIQELILEVTRRCNMNCSHCLRGECQNMDMQKELVDSIMSQVSFIGQLFFTGGEPSLNLELIQYAFESAKRHGVDVASFGLVTNGLINQKELAMILLHAYADFDMADNDGDYPCYVAVSVDQFHSNEGKPNYMKAFSFYSDEHEGLYRPEEIIAMGRSANKAQARKHLVQEIEINDYEDSYDVTSLYLAADGNILGDCDLSYDIQGFYAEGNLKDSSLEMILSRIVKENEAEAI